MDTYKVILVCNLDQIVSKFFYLSSLRLLINDWQMRKVFHSVRGLLTTICRILYSCKGEFTRRKWCQKIQISFYSLISFFEIRPISLKPFFKYVKIIFLNTAFWKLSKKIYNENCCAISSVRVSISLEFVMNFLKNSSEGLPHLNSQKHFRKNYPLIAAPITVIQTRM